MFRGCSVLFLKLQFLAFLAAGTAFAIIPFGVLGFFGLLAIPDAWRSSNSSLRTASTLGLAGAIGWAIFAVYQMRGPNLTSANSSLNKLVVLGMAALIVVTIVSALMIGGIGNRPKKG